MIRLSATRQNSHEFRYLWDVAEFVRIPDILRTRQEAAPCGFQTKSAPDLQDWAKALEFQLICAPAGSLLMQDREIAFLSPGGRDAEQQLSA